MVVLCTQSLLERHRTLRPIVVEQVLFSQRTCIVVSTRDVIEFSILARARDDGATGG